jgi:hypothetical protein
MQAYDRGKPPRTLREQAILGLFVYQCSSFHELPRGG